MKLMVCLAAGVLAAGVVAAQNQGTQGNTSTSSSTSSSTSTQTSSTGNMPEMKTQTYKGTLVDASCAMPGSASSTATSTTSTADRNTESQSGKKNEANRAANDAGQSCNVSSATTQFGMKLNDGRVVRFDSVGNQRAQEALKNKKKWMDASSSGKAIHAKVTGTMTGDKLTVTSVQ